MFVLDHVSITVQSLERARPFYDAIMSSLGIEKVYDREDALGYGVRCSENDVQSTCVAIYSSSDASNDARRHVCFKAKSRDMVRAFHAAGLLHGGTDEGAPGLRPKYHASYFGAFLADPAGNRVEAVFHGPDTTGTDSP